MVCQCPPTRDHQEHICSGFIACSGKESTCHGNHGTGQSDPVRDDKILIGN